MDILISISELEYQNIGVLALGIQMPASQSHRLVHLAPESQRHSRPGLRACIYASLSRCVFPCALCFPMRVVFSHARPSNKHDRLCGKKWKRPPLAPRHDMKKPRTVKKNHFYRAFKGPILTVNDRIMCRSLHIEPKSVNIWLSKMILTTS